MLYIDKLADPIWLLVLIVIAIIVLLVRNRGAVFYSVNSQIRSSRFSRSLSFFVNTAKRALLALAIILVALMLARPLVLNESYFTEKEVRKIGLSVDVSTSMSGQGIQRIRVTVGNFVKNRRGDWISISAYSGNYGKEGGAGILRTLSPNTELILSSVETLEPRMFGAFTALGEGVWCAVISVIQDELEILENEKGIKLSLTDLRQAMKDHDKDYIEHFCQLVGRQKNRVIIIFTDGIYNTGIHPSYPINLAKQMGIKIYMVALKPTAATGVSQEVGMQRMNEIKNATINTGGSWFDGESYDDIEKLYQRISELEKASVFIRVTEKLEDNYHQIALLALLCFCGFLALEYIWIKIP